jgi:hypothetical protein
MYAMFKFVGLSVPPVIVTSHVNSIIASFAKIIIAYWRDIIKTNHTFYV